MRIVSVAGIIALLVLQYFWIGNAYFLFKQGIVEKCKESLKEAVDQELVERLNTLKNCNVSIGGPINFKPGDEIIAGRKVNDGNDFNRGIQDLMTVINKTCNIKRVDAIFQQRIFHNLDFIPQHTIRIIDDSVRSKVIPEKPEHGFIFSRNRMIINNIYVKLTANQSIEVTLTSPSKLIIQKATFILMVSILLVLLIGFILLLQLKSAIKEKEFTGFMKEYTRILAHETRTPINDIYLMTSNLMSNSFPDEEKKHLYYNECLNQCTKMLLGIDNMLFAAKWERSKIPISKTLVDLRIFIEKIVEKYRNSYFIHKDLVIKTHYDSEELKAYIDANLMENVLLNLIENAIKYSNESLEISISCAIKNKHLLIQVRDNGFGIPNEDLKHIFQEFSRGKRIAKGSIKGYGIGLFYVYKVVKAHRGTVNVKSVLNLGTEFMIDIPNRFL